MNFHAFSMKNNNNQWKSILHGSRFTIGFPIVNIDEIGGRPKTQIEGHSMFRLFRDAVVAQRTLESIFVRTETK